MVCKSRPVKAACDKTVAAKVQMGYNQILCIGERSAGREFSFSGFLHPGSYYCFTLEVDYFAFSPVVVRLPGVVDQ